jgi:predicted nucleic acid-binding protein
VGWFDEAAREAGCVVLYSEDLQDGRKFDQVEVRNPLA